MDGNLEDIRIKIQKMAELAELKGEPFGWFDELYENANRQSEDVPWARMEPHPKLVEWVANRPDVNGKALVVGCGLGDDAEWLDEIGFDVTAFDISKSSIDWCRERFPHSSVNYCVSDLFAPPKNWINEFDLIVEIHILQVIPENLRDQAAEKMSLFLNDNGHLLCIGRLLEMGVEEQPTPPWPLGQVWLESRFQHLKLVNFTRFISENNNVGDFPPLPRFIAAWKKL